MVAADSPAQLGGLLTGPAPGSRIAGSCWRSCGRGQRRPSSARVMSRLGRVVAMKLPAADVDGPATVPREARAVAAVDHQLHHPSSRRATRPAALHRDSFVAGDDLRLVVRSEELRRRRAARPSPVASALDAAHGAVGASRCKPADMLVDVGPGRPDTRTCWIRAGRGHVVVGGPTRAGSSSAHPLPAPEQFSGSSVDGRGISTRSVRGVHAADAR